MSRLINPDIQFFDNVTGLPLSFGTVYFGEPNQDPETNPKAVYSDADLSTAISPSQDLDAAGKPDQDIFLNGAYSITAKSALGIIQFTESSYSGDGLIGAAYVIPVTSRGGMKAYDAPPGTQFSLEEGGRSGQFVVKSGTPPSDPQEGIYVVLDNGNYAMRRYDSISPVGGLNVKWFGAKGDGITVDTVAIQAAINYSYGNTLGFPVGEYISGELTVNKGISLEGSLRTLSPVSYSDDASRINFSEVSGGNYGLTVSPSPDEIIGFSMNNLAFKGTTGIGGLDLAGTLSQDIKDSQFNNCYFFNFETGTRQEYLISSSWRNCRWQSCTNGIESNNQCNALSYTQCSITTVSNLAIKFANNEGVHFDSCNISNLSRATAPITTFQSSVIFTNGYFENITSDFLIQVGSSGEADGVESKVSFIHPLKMGGDIRAAKHKAHVELIGGCRDDVNVISSVRDSVEGGVVSGRNSAHTPYTYVEIYKAGEYPDFRDYQAASFTYDQRRGFYRVDNSGSIATGAYISRDLVDGEIYTLSFAARIPAGGNASLSARTGSTVLSFGDRIPQEPEKPEVLNCTFVSDGSDLIFQWSGEIDFYGYTVQKGNLRELDTRIFATAESARKPVNQTGLSAPTAGAWNRGDKVYNVSPVAGGSAGWICVATGAPGTWKSFGSIAA